MSYSKLGLSVLFFSSALIGMQDSLQQSFCSPSLAQKEVSDISGDERVMQLLMRDLLHADTLCDDYINTTEQHLTPTAYNAALILKDFLGFEAHQKDSLKKALTKKNKEAIKDWESIPKSDKNNDGYLDVKKQVKNREAS